MPAYNFQARFAPKVESGEKNHTIRGKRRHPPRPGQRFAGFTGMRTKQCRKLVESTITRVQDIWIEMLGGETKVPVVTVDEVQLSPDECEQLALRDGFESFADMFRFWDGRRPFNGDIIHWLPPTKAK